MLSPREGLRGSSPSSVPEGRRKRAVQHCQYCRPNPKAKGLLTGNAFSSDGGGSMSRVLEDSDTPLSRCILRLGAPDQSILARFSSAPGLPGYFCSIRASGRIQYIRLQALSAMLACHIKLFSLLLMTLNVRK